MTSLRAMLHRTVALAATAASAVLLGTAGAPAATSSTEPAALAPAATVVNPRCTFDEDRADGWTRRNGTEHVVYQVDNNESFTCVAGSQWYAWRKPGGEWQRERTPYVGRLMAVTGERRSVYLLYADGAGVHLAKRNGAGQYRELELLSPQGLGTRILPSGDLVVRDGRWWAVWSENRTPDRYGFTDLWQAKTLGADLDRTRVTDTEIEHDDLPALALRDDGTGFLLWTTKRDDPGAPSYVRSGVSDGGPWATEPWDSGFPGSAGDLAVQGNGALSVVWNRGLVPMYADDRTGSFVPEPVLGQGGPPSVAVSGGQIHVSTTAPGFRAHLLSRPVAGGAWQDEPVTTDSVSRSLDVLSSGGAATIFYSDESRLLERSAQ